MNKWDVVLLSYPFTDLSGAKVRPAIVISPTAYNQVSQDGVFILITSNTARRSAYDLVVPRAHAEFQLTGLRHDSAIRVDKIFALNKKLLVQTLGRVGPQLQREVERQLRAFLELPGDQLALKMQFDSPIRSKERPG
jgi:mRNA interferase MazF